jgi:DNA-binding PadR family transcriptional regulator
LPAGIDWSFSEGLRAVWNCGQNAEALSYRFSISQLDFMAADDLLRHFYGGFVRLHILYHAAKESIYGVEMMEELARHGYRLGPGTMYPILHDLESGGYLTASSSVVAGKRRKTYRITNRGERLMTGAKARLRELFLEVIEDRDKLAGSRKSGRGGRTVTGNARS